MPKKYKAKPKRISGSTITNKESKFLTEDDVRRLYTPPYAGTFDRPARQQTKEVDKWDHDATMYNIWYHRKVGDYQSRRLDERVNPNFRCVPARDSGCTRSKEDSWICIYYARGKCTQGDECTFLHRIPNEKDEERLDLTYDIFGRERHITDREDMGGIGSFSRENRTLYVGGIRKIKGVTMEDLVLRNFIEWGDIEYVRVIMSKSIAFVRYKLRAAAEFAKEAMGDQSLGYNEVLNVRWSNVDPNPRAIKQEAESLERRVKEAVKTRYANVAQYDVTGAQYPNTDHHFTGGVSPYGTTTTTTTTTSTSTSQSDGVISLPPGIRHTPVMMSTANNSTSEPQVYTEEERQQAWSQYYAQMGHAGYEGYTYPSVVDDGTSNVASTYYTSEEQTTSDSSSKISEEQIKQAWVEYYKQMGYDASYENTKEEIQDKRSAPEVKEIQQKKKKKKRT